MDHFSFLQTTAEIAITFAGFISVFVVLAQRDGSFEPGAALLIRFVLLSSVSCLFLSALPLVLSGLSITGQTLWRLCSGVCLISGIAISTYAVRNRRDFEPSVLVPIAYTVNAAVFCTLVANVVGWPAPPNGGLYLASIWLILGIASINFIDLVFHRLLKPPAV